MKNASITIIVIVIVVVLAVMAFWKYNQGNRPAPTSDNNTTTTVTSTATSSATSTYPSKNDLIMVENLQAGQKISSPVTVTGQARGNWYFEASFPVKVLDNDDAVIGGGIATAQGEWMTTDYVPFSATVEFNPGTSTQGVVVLQKDNPSGLPENDDELAIPVTF